ALRHARIEPKTPKGTFTDFRKTVWVVCHTRLWPSLSDSITGTALSLARKDYDSPLLVLHNSDSNLPGRLAYSSLPEHAVRLLAQRDFGCLHPLGHELA